MPSSSCETLRPTAVHLPFIIVKLQQWRMSHLQCFHCHLLTSSFSNLANMRRAADRLEFSQVFIDKLTTHFVLPAIGDYILLVAHIWAFRTSTPTPNEAKTAMSFAQPWVTKHWGKRIRTLHNDNWPQTGLRKVTQWLAMSMWGPLSGCAKRGCPKRGEVVAAKCATRQRLISDWFCNLRDGQRLILVKNSRTWHSWHSKLSIFQCIMIIDIVDLPSY